MADVGDSIGRYVVEAVLGEGGMGRVYRALDPRLGRRVALKVLLAEGSEHVRGEAAARMVREARAAAAFNHPNVVAIYDVGEADGAPYIAMELVVGTTLRNVAAREGVLIARIVGWLSDVARGLAAAHGSGLVHRDIKPDNVMVTTTGVVKILDFGIARHADVEPSDVDSGGPTAAARLPSITADGHMIGTPHYMAPEQLRGEPVDGRCDQFAWGVMAWELLAGRSPWGSPTNPAVLLTSVLFTPVRPLREVVPQIALALSDVVGRALSKDRNHRFPTMGALLAALEEASASTPEPATQSDETYHAPGKLTPAEAVAATEAASPAVVSSRSVTPSATAPDASVGKDTVHPSGFRPGVAAAGVLGLLVIAMGAAWGVRQRSFVEASATQPLPSASAARRDAQVVAVAGPEDNLFPCKDTRRTLIPPHEDEGCIAGTLGWCATDGMQIGCCPEGMVARTREGTCECPPGGVEADSPLAKCPRASAAIHPGSEAGPAVRLAPEVIQGVVRANYGRLRRCYEAALKKNPLESGRLKVWFEIGPTGRVFFAHLRDTTLADPAAQECMLQELRAFQFPQPVGGVVTVVYPISFYPDD